jgi:hypothetical protein
MFCCSHVRSTLGVAVQEVGAIEPLSRYLANGLANAVLITTTTLLYFFHRKTVKMT